MLRRLAQLALSLLPACGQVLETVAGGGAGDGGPALEANLAGPEGVAVDRAGNIYIADTSNHRIRKVDPKGTIHTIAGDGLPGLLRFPVGVAAAADGEVFIADTHNHRVVRLDGSVVTKASLKLPSAVAILPNGSLLIADSGNGRILRVERDGSAHPIATAFGRPVSIAAGADGGVYVSDAGSKRILRIAADGKAEEIARLPRPFGIALDTGGGLFATDEERGQVVRINSPDVVTIEGGLGSPQGITVDGAGNVYVAEFARNVIRKMSPNGASRVMAGNGEPFFSGDGGPARNAALNYPHGIAVDSAGNLWIADTENNRVRRVSADGAISTVASGLARPLGVAVDAAANAYIADTNNHRVRVVDRSGSIRTVGGTGIAGFGGDGGPAEAAMLNYPSAVAVAGSLLYVADSGNRRIRAIDNGAIYTVAENLPGPSAIAVDRQGEVWIADRADHRIRRLTQHGRVETIDTPSLSRPLGLAVDAEGTIFMSSGDGHSIYKVDASGHATVVAGVPAGLRTPAGLAIGPGGALYVADSGNHRIRRLAGAAAPPFTLSRAGRPPAIQNRAASAVSNNLAPYVATPENIAVRMLEMAEVKASDVVYDLGSGDGRIPILAAKRFGARGVGIEIDNALVRIARENVRQAGVASRVRIDAGDALTADLSPATVIALYLLPETLPRLRPVIENLRRPVRVISHDAPVEGWTPTVTESIPGASGRVHLLYRYDLNRYRER